MATNFEARLANYSSPILSVFRIVFGLMFTVHGTQKLFNWPIATPMPIAVGDWPGWWAGLIEVVCGLLITFGLFTRIAAFVASGEMAVAYFWMHWPPLQGEAAPFWPIANGGETAVLLCFGFLLLAALGAGAWSFEARRRRTGVARAGAPVASGRTAPPAGGGLLSRLRGRRY
jgi:putative oxidoreductase